MSILLHSAEQSNPAITPNGHHELFPADDLADLRAIAEGQRVDLDAYRAEQREKEAQEALLTQGAHDEGNAQCVNLRYYGRFVQNGAFGWRHHTGTHWTQDGAEEALERAITETLTARIDAALKSGKADQYKDLISKSIPNAGRVQGAKSQLSSIVYASVDTFDNMPDMLNCKNGVVDLRTGQLTPHCPDQRFTHCAIVAYKPDANYQPWVKWLTEAVRGGADTVAWLQMAVGYSLTGYTREEILFYLFGPPRSGKGTFTDALLNMLGAPLADAVSFYTLTAPREVDAQNFNLAPLHNARLIAASESNAYERFNEAKVKMVTGGDKIQCSFKHKTPFSYKPKYKIWLSSNQPVNADPDDDAVWGRIRVIEFPNSHLDREDKTLKERMRSSEMLEGVLAWAIEGARKWYALGSAGLTELASSKAVKSQHRQALDNVQSWIDENCFTGSGGFTSNSYLYLSYERWCKDNGVEAKKQKGFSQALIRKGFEAKLAKIDGKMLRGFVGIAIA